MFGGWVFLIVLAPCKAEAVATENAVQLAKLLWGKMCQTV